MPEMWLVDGSRGAFSLHIVTFCVHPIAEMVVTIDRMFTCPMDLTRTGFPQDTKMWIRSPKNLGMTHHASSSFSL